MPPELASTHTLIDALFALGGFSGVAGLNIIAFVKLKTRVEMATEQNAREHKAISKKLDELNGTGRDNEKAIVSIEATCRANHG